MKKNGSWKFADESSVTFQSSVSEVGEFGLSLYRFEFKVLLIIPERLDILLDRYLKIVVAIVAKDPEGTM